MLHPTQIASSVSSAEATTSINSIPANSNPNINPTFPDTGSPDGRLAAFTKISHAPEYMLVLRSPTAHLVTYLLACLLQKVEPRHVQYGMTFGTSVSNAVYPAQTAETWLQEFSQQISADWDFTAVHINKNNMDGVAADIVQLIIILEEPLCSVWEAALDNGICNALRFQIIDARQNVSVRRVRDTAIVARDSECIAILAQTLVAAVEIQESNTDSGQRIDAVYRQLEEEYGVRGIGSMVLSLLEEYGIDSSSRSATLQWFHELNMVKPPPPHPPAYLTAPDGSTATTPTEKANVPHTKFFPPKASLPPPDPPTNPSSGLTSPFPSIFTTEDIHWAIAKLFPWKAPGRSAGLRIGHFPKSWRVFLTVTIRKPGKNDYTVPGAHRPIAEEECLDKVVESAHTAYTLYTTSKVFTSEGHAPKIDTQQASSPTVPLFLLRSFSQRRLLRLCGQLLLDHNTDKRSSSITPPPQIKRKAPAKAPKKVSKKAAPESVDAPEDTFSSDSDSDTVPPPKEKKKVKSGEPEVLCHDQRKIVLSVPRATEAGN
ncbi:hypothetical protein B0H13DRAFT_2301580 [Mycena leptocephala]|nr:hypothetical protein B0H13DRAFT_2301580 [Mycena leptocephala]